MFAVSLALTACAPDDDHDLGTYNISPDQISFVLTPGSNEWTYNYAVSFSDDLSTIYTYSVDFGDGASTKNPTGTHEYVVAAGEYTAKCTVYTPDGNMIAKEIPVTISNDNPGIYLDDVNSLQYALTGGKENTAGKVWHIGSWSAMRNPQGSDTAAPFEEVWWNYNGPDPSMMNDEVTFTPNSVNPNGGYQYVTNGDIFVNESAAGSFPDGNSTGSFVSTNYTPPTDATWAVSQRDGKTYLAITKGFVGYVSRPGDLEKTEYEVLSYSPENIRLSLAIDPQWCMELTSKPVPKNLWNDIEFANTFYYAQGEGWTVLPNPELTINGTQYTLNLPSETNMQWQCQVAFVSSETKPLIISPTENYDFFVTLNASNAIGGVTVKFCQDVEGDTPVFFDQRVDLPAGEDVVFEQTDLSGVDITKGKLLFDFGGNPANTTVVIKKITLQVHPVE